MTSAAYQKAFDEFTRQGYRLRTVSGCGLNGSDFYAAEWEKADGPPWAARHGMTSADYQRAFDQFMQQGYRLRCVSGYAVGGRDLYAALWEKTGGPAWGARHGMDSAAYQKAFDEFTRRGYRPRWVSTYALGGRDFYAAVWEQSPGPAWEARHGMTEAAFQAKSVSLAQQGYRLRCVCACSPAGQDLYAAIWEKAAGPVAVAHHGMTSDTYQLLFDQLTGQGFRPSLVSTYAGSQPVDAVLRFTMQRQQQSNWCWAATSVSIAGYYDPNSTRTQCAMANGQLDRSDCSPAAGTTPTLSARNYTLGLDAIADGRGLPAARLGVWTHLLPGGGGRVLAADTAAGSGQFAQLVDGPHAEAVQRQVAALQADPAVTNGSYDLALLRVPALFTVAVWLQDTAGGADLVVPVAPADPALQPGKLYAPADFVAALQPAARQKLADTHPTKGG